MRFFDIFKAVTAMVAFVVGAVMLTLPGRPGPLVPWLVMGFLACVMVADFLEILADRKEDQAGDEQ